MKPLPAFLLCALLSLMAGCVSKPAAVPQAAAEPPFTAFPAAFRALQVVEVQAGNRKETLLANLVRGPGAAFEVTFLHALLQQPIVRLRYDGTRTTAERFVDIGPVPFGPEKIMDSIVRLYTSSGFTRQSASTYTLQDSAFRYELSQLAAIPCVFPRSIVLTHHAAQATEVQSAGAAVARANVPPPQDQDVRLNIHTQEWECVSP